MKILACKDMGINCDYVAKGDTEEQAIKNGMRHAEKNHPEHLAEMRKTMSKDQMMEATKSKIKDM